MIEKKPSILFILHLPPPVHGAAMVGKSIQESKIINDSFNTEYINLSTSSKLNEIGKGGLGKLLVFFRLQVNVVSALLSKRYNLCYITLTAKGPGFYKDFFIILLLKLFHPKIIYHFHNKGVSSRESHKFQNLLYKFTFNNAKSILLSEYLYPDIQKYVDKRDVYFCANGIHVDNPRIEYSRIINNDMPCRLLFLSNMMGAKGVFILLEACKVLKEEGVFFECHFVGEWSDVSRESFNHEVQSKNLADNVFAHGKKYGSDKQQILLNSDIFIHPTLNDCFPLVILEAMQAALPVIASEEGAIPEMITDGETGFLIPKGNAVALADKIKLLVRQPQLRSQMGTEGKKRYEERFTLEKFENNLCEILKQAIER